MSSRPAWVWVAVLSSSACSSNELFFDWPQMQPDVASVIVVTQDGTGLSAVARAWDPERELTFSTDDPIALAVVGYTETLEELGFEPEGEIEQAHSPNGCLARTLLPAAAVYSRSIDEASWSEDLFQAAQELLLLARCPCGELQQVEQIRTERAFPNSVAVVRGDDLFIIAGRSGATRIDLTDTSTGIEDVPGPSTYAPNDAWVDVRSGDIWLSGAEILRWSGELGEPAVVHRRPGPQEKFAHGLDGAPAGHDFELYVSLDPDRLLKLSEPDGEWEELVNAPTFGIDSSPDQEGRVAWISPDHVVASMQDSRIVVLYDHGRSKSFDRTPLMGAVRSMVWTEEYGVLLGSAAGTIGSLAEDGTITFLRTEAGPSFEPGRIGEMVAYPGGALVVSSGPAAVAQIAAPMGICRWTELPDLSSVNDIALFSEQLVVVGQTVRDETEISIFELTTR